MKFRTRHQKVPNLNVAFLTNCNTIIILHWTGTNWAPQCCIISTSPIIFTIIISFTKVSQYKPEGLRSKGAEEGIPFPAQECSPNHLPAGSP